MAGDRAEALARRLFPDDYHDGSDCRAEVGREGQPCRACAERAEAWQARLAQVRTSLTEVGIDA